MRFSTALLLLVVGYAAAASYPPTALKQSAIPREKVAKCPGGKSSCETNQTCCKLTSGGYGCCPYSNATCCSDGEHCCPKDYSCEPKTGACVRRHTAGVGESLPIVQKLDSSPLQVTCLDGGVCESGQTCCRLLDGSFGCCPYTNGTCCLDFQHCCPNYYDYCSLGGVCHYNN